MTRDDIIRMAREAGGIECDCCLPYLQDYSEKELAEFLERFAELVAAADTALLKRCLQAIEEVYKTGDTQVFDLCHAQFLIPLLHKRLGVGSESTNDS